MYHPPPIPHYNERWIKKLHDLWEAGKLTKDDVEQLIFLITSAMDMAENEGRYGRDC